MLFKLSLVLLLLAAVTEAQSAFEAYQQIPGRVPIIPNEILNKTFSVKNVEQCKKHCLVQGSKDLIYSKNQHRRSASWNDVMLCTCLPQYLWYRHGLVAAPEADLYISLSDNAILNSFLFLDTPPIGGRLSTDHSQKASVEECALTCLNYRGDDNCRAFLFDIISHECLLYSNTRLRKGNFYPDMFVNGVNRLYFEKLSRFEQYFTAMPRIILTDGQNPEVSNGLTLEECSRKCVLHKDCLAFNYIPHKNQCELLRQTRRDTVNMKNDPNSIHFEMIPTTSCGNGRSDARWALIRSPGWPYQLSQQFMKGSTCTWDILTPWGLTVKLDYIYFNLEYSDGACQQSLQIGAEKPMCSSSSQPYKQTSEVTTFNMTVKRWPKNSEELSKRIGFFMSYTLDWTINSDMRDTGVIACPGFPKAMKPTKTSWNIITNKPNQKVLIDFQAFNMKKNPSSSDEGYLKFMQGGRVIKKCEGETLEPACQKTMTFYGDVTLDFHSGLYLKGEYPPGFKLIYAVGDQRSNLKDEARTIFVKLNGTYVVNETNLQERYKTVDNIIKIRNPNTTGTIELRILDLHLADPDEANDCSVDSLRVMDPFSKHVNYTFCGRTTPQETIYSFGNELYVFVKVAALPFTDKYKPERSYIIQARRKMYIPPEIFSVEEETSIALTKSQYLPNKHIQWSIKGTEILEPRLTFRYIQLAEFKFQGQSFCDNDRLTIGHGPEVISTCGINQTLANKPLYTNNNEIAITFKSDDIISGTGFLADVEMVSTSRCKPGEVIKVTAGDVEFLMSEKYPAMQVSKAACSWQILTENSTGVLVTVLEGEKFLSIEESEQSNDKTAQLSGGKTLHLPTDTIVSWSGGTRGKFLATIQSLDLTTTTTSTTPEPTTTSTTEVTTEAPTTATTATTTNPPTTSTANSPNVGKQEKKKDPGPMIGAGVGAAIILLVASVLIIWKVRDSRRLEKIEAPGDFINSGLFKPPDEVIHNYSSNQTAFENPAYVEHQSSMNDLNYDGDTSEYVMMGDDQDAKNDREFSHLSSNVNSLYGTSNPYEEFYH